MYENYFITTLYQRCIFSNKDIIFYLGKLSQFTVSYSTHA